MSLSTVGDDILHLLQRLLLVRQLLELQLWPWADDHGAWAQSG